MKKLTALFLLISLNLSAQKEYSNWVMAHSAGIDFNHTLPKPILFTDTSIGTHTYEGTSAISDSNGKLLFYTNGVKVWNRDHNLVPYSIDKDLYGSVSTTQSALVIPIPNSTRYYIFTAPDSEYGIVKGNDEASLCYTIFDISLDGGLGDVVIANQPLIKQSTEKLCGYKMSDNTFWVCGIEWNTNNIHLFKVDETGISQKIVNSVGRPHKKYAVGYSESVGEMHFSPDGSMLAYVNEDSRTYEIFKFDTLTGNLTELYIDSMKKEKDYTFIYGCSFSPSGKYFYFTHGTVRRSEIYQVDLSDFSKRVVARYDYASFGMQVGLDGRIYVIRQSEYNKYKPSGVNVIYKPNSVYCDIREGAQCVGFSKVNWGSFNYPQFKIEVKDEDITSVEEPEIFIPNAFSPNGDNLNDVFNPLNTMKVSDVQSYYIRILDRWGNRVFEENESTKRGWNGKDLRTQRDCELGTYYYSLVVNGKNYTGEINLVK